MLDNVSILAGYFRLPNLKCHKRDNVMCVVERKRNNSIPSSYSMHYTVTYAPVFLLNSVDTFNW